MLEISALNLKFKLFWFRVEGGRLRWVAMGGDGWLLGAETLQINLQLRALLREKDWVANGGYLHFFRIKNPPSFNKNVSR